MVWLVIWNPFTLWPNETYLDVLSRSTCNEDVCSRCRHGVPVGFGPFVVRVNLLFWEIRSSTNLSSLSFSQRDPKLLWSGNR
jgi:hypothetical protein